MPLGRAAKPPPRRSQIGRLLQPLRVDNLRSLRGILALFAARRVPQTLRDARRMERSISTDPLVSASTRA